MRGVVGGVVGGRGGFEIGDGGGGAEGLGGEGIEGGRDLLGDVEDGPDSAVDEALPVAGVVFGSQPDAGDDLDGAVGVGDSGGAALFLHAMEEGGGGAGGGGEGDGGETAGGRGRGGGVVCGESEGESLCVFATAHGRGGGWERRGAERRAHFEESTTSVRRSRQRGPLFAACLASLLAPVWPVFGPCRRLFARAVWLRASPVWPPRHAQPVPARVPHLDRCRLLRALLPRPPPPPPPRRRRLQPLPPHPPRPPHHPRPRLPAPSHEPRQPSPLWRGGPHPHPHLPPLSRLRLHHRRHLFPPHPLRYALFSAHAPSL
jgi:hypothetical protein